MTNHHFDFKDIAPFDDSQFQEKMAQLVKEPGFENAVRYVMPDVDYPQMAAELCSIKTKDELQHKVMYPFLEMLAARTTNGISYDGIDNVEPDKPAHTFITNHRDIVLDASFLNLCFLRADRKTSEIAIGNNLLIYEWIDDLVRLNKSFIVRRNLPISKALEAAMELSAYIHHTVDQRQESVWIAQREGRSKDSNDLTQESLIKMLAIGGDGDFVECLKQIRLTPVTISYEYDPNDYLKAREFLLKRLDPKFKKSQRDDLFSMETGLLQPKGRVHFSISPCINDELDLINRKQPKAVQVKEVCRIIDRSIHSRYRIYPVNYIAYDMLHGSNRFAEEYTADQKAAFEQRIESQLSKTELPDPSHLDMSFMRQMVLTMYANPLANKLTATKLQ